VLAFCIKTGGTQSSHYGLKGWKILAEPQTTATDPNITKQALFQHLPSLRIYDSCAVLTSQKGTLKFVMQTGARFCCWRSRLSRGIY